LKNGNQLLLGQTVSTMNITQIRDTLNGILTEKIITFDSVSSSMDERKKSVTLRLQAREYDNKKNIICC
jgi:hypothetical protein